MDMHITIIFDNEIRDPQLHLGRMTADIVLKILQSGYIGVAG